MIMMRTQGAWMRHMKNRGLTLHFLHHPTPTLHAKNDVLDSDSVGCRESVGFLGLTPRKKFIYAISPVNPTLPTLIFIFVVQDWFFEV